MAAGDGSICATPPGFRYMSICLGAFLAMAITGFAPDAAAAEDARVAAQSLPPKVLILGVPYVSWREAA